MLRVVAICAAIVGCGRFRFDPLGGSGIDDSGTAPDGSEIAPGDDAPLDQPHTVQRASRAVPNAAQVNTALPQGVIAGNALVVAASAASSSGTPTVSDSQGNTYSLAITDTGPGNEAVIAIYVAVAGTTGPLTVTCGIADTDNIHCHVYEVAGVTGVVQATGSAIDSAPALAVMTATPITRDGAYVLAYFAANNDNILITTGTGYGDGEYSMSLSNDVAFSEARVADGNGVQTATAAAAGSTVTFVNAIAALEPR